MIQLKPIIIIIICMLLIYFNYEYKTYIEGLEDIGDPNKSFVNAPIAYKEMTKSVKNSLLKNIDEKYKNLTINSKYNSDYFNKIENRKYYNDSEMEMDFKYFNNASNLSLYHLYNPST